MDIKQLTESLKTVLKEFYDVEPDDNLEMEIVGFGKEEGTSLTRYELDGIEFYKANDEELENAVGICIEEEFMPSWRENNGITSYTINSIDFDDETDVGIAFVTVFADNLDENIKSKNLIKEELDKDVHYEFTIKRVSEDELQLTSGESVYSVAIYPDDDLQLIRYVIEDFVDYELAADEEDNENITGTEVSKFKYDMETGEGEFEATIFFEDDSD